MFPGYAASVLASPVDGSCLCKGQEQSDAAFPMGQFFFNPCFTANDRHVQKSFNKFF